MRRPRRLEVQREPGFYYVTVVDGSRYLPLLGPFKYHRQARRFVRRAQEHAVTHYRFACFYAYGTARLPDGRFEGVFNSALGITRVSP